MADDAKDSNDFDRCFRYYEKAIAGRNFHYKNYNAWVNLYAIFNGALFAGFCALCDKDMPMVSFIVCALGFVSAVCWHHCVRGHYHWMRSWINVVHKYEEALAKFPGKDRAYFVYDVYLPNKEADFFQQNISTGRVTVLFTFAVIAAWVMLLLYQGWEYVRCFCRCWCFWHTSRYIAVGCIALIVFALIFMCFFVCTLHSETHNMKDTIYESK